MSDKNTKVSCNGGDTALGHPKVYLEFGSKSSVECPYCGKKFTADKKVKK